MYKHFIKRLLDIVLSAIMIVVLSPLYVVIAVIVAVTMGMPIVYAQDRIGKNERVFRLFKFRSMTNATDAEGKLLDEQERLTRAGVILRSFSLDELPELFLILIGKMSFVGPRPLPTYYDPYFHENERKRHKVKGGLIPPDGLCGQTTPSWETQFEYDNYYVDHVSFLIDCKVIFATFKILIKRVANNYGAEDRPHLNEYRKDEIKV